MKLLMNLKVIMTHTENQKNIQQMFYDSKHINSRKKCKGINPLYGKVKQQSPGEVGKTSKIIEGHEVKIL